MRALIPAVAFAMLGLLVRPGSETSPQPNHERDVQLVLTPGDKLDFIEPGGSPWVRLSLFNASNRFTYPVVIPGDGSELGWRDPHIFYTAVLVQPDGTTSDVPKARYRRCGLYDGFPACLELKPREGMRINPDYTWTLLEFQKPGRVRLRAHYRFGSATRSRSLGIMVGVPPFELVSNPVDFEVRRLIDVRVVVKRPMKAMVEHRLSDILDVELSSLSGDTKEIRQTAVLDLEVDAQLGWYPKFFSPGSEDRFESFAGTCSRPPAELGPNGVVSLLGPGRLDGRWQYPTAETVKVRAAFRPGGSDRRVYYSDWAEVRVGK